MIEQKILFREEQIAAYARASGDMNPIHLDARFAQSVGLPGVIAHGMLQMSMAAIVAATAAGGAKRLRQLSVRFAGMVEPGDTVTFTAANPCFALTAGGGLNYTPGGGLQDSP